MMSGSALGSLRRLGPPLLSRPRGFASKFPEAQTIWKDGALVPWQDANVHILSTAVQFGNSLFEGMRCYSTPNGPAIVHLHGHLRRLLDSCKMYRIAVPYTAEELAAACFEVVTANGLDRGCYIRPMVLRGYGAVGMDGAGSPIETYVPAWEWGAYLGAEAFATGIDCGTASWSRPAPNTFPGMCPRWGSNPGLAESPLLASLLCLHSLTSPSFDPHRRKGQGGRKLHQRAADQAGGTVEWLCGGGGARHGRDGLGGFGAKHLPGP